MTLFNMIETEHQDLYKALKGFSQEAAQGDPQQSRIRLKQFAQQLLFHLQIEESIVYPPLEHIPTLHTVMEKAQDDHKQLKLLIRQMDVESYDLQKSDIQEVLSLVSDRFERHVKLVETRFFPEMKEHLPDDLLSHIAEQIALRKAKRYPTDGE